MRYDYQMGEDMQAVTCSSFRRDHSSNMVEVRSNGTYIAANGQALTDEQIDGWCDAYEQGEFPEGEHTVGRVVHGRPPLSVASAETISIKVPVGKNMK